MLRTSESSRVTTGCHVPLTSICLDLKSQARARVYSNIVQAYATAMITQQKDGAVHFPPVILFFDRETYWIADGFHRVLASEKAGLRVVLAEVHAGNQRDALLYSLAANNAHGLPRTNADKRKVVSLLLTDSEWWTWSDREIARHCQVSNRFVSNMRRRLSVNGSQMRGRIVRRAGAIYAMHFEDSLSTKDTKAHEAKRHKPEDEKRREVELGKGLYSQLEELLDRIARGPCGGELARRLQRTGEKGSERFVCTELQSSRRKLIEWATSAGIEEAT
jgi:hypothetical protein